MFTYISQFELMGQWYRAESWSHETGDGPVTRCNFYQWEAGDGMQGAWDATPIAMYDECMDHDTIVQLFKDYTTEAHEAEVTVKE